MIGHIGVDYHSTYILSKLISDVSDALEKTRYEFITGTDKFKTQPSFYIRTSPDKAKSKFTIEDFFLSRLISDASDALDNIGYEFIFDLRTEKQNPRMCLKR